ncbi:TPA: O-antigen ligase family protein [Staphylococcus aureus]|uniref:O-antigen ligase family protein n=1 Tax=Staphylococcus aureus TaxID=1280 RepID=UPI000CDB411B|nr:O-antigen ligase family protein [Staphylococcus aureus]HDA4219850.1 hypothetical protein [Staphylococcus aureus]HEK6687985.1 hypothetical protein [Staphylococcus aureus]
MNVLLALLLIPILVIIYFKLRKGAYNNKLRLLFLLCAIILIFCLPILAILFFLGGSIFHILFVRKNIKNDLIKKSEITTTVCFVIACLLSSLFVIVVSYNDIDNKEKIKQTTSKPVSNNKKENDDEKERINQENKNQKVIEQPTYYDDPQINQQVYNNITKSMEKLNALTGQDIKKYKVNTQIYNQDKKPNAIVTVDLKGVDVKGESKYRDEDLEYNASHISSNFVGRNEISGGFHGYFEKLIVRFKKDDREIGEATVTFEGYDSLDEKIKLIRFD